MEDDTQEVKTEELSDSQKLLQILSELTHLNQRFARLEERDEARALETRPALDRIYQELANATFGLNDLKLEVRFFTRRLGGRAQRTRIVRTSY